MNSELEHNETVSGLLNDKDALIRMVMEKELSLQDSYKAREGLERQGVEGDTLSDTILIGETLRVEDDP